MQNLPVFGPASLGIKARRQHFSLVLFTLSVTLYIRKCCPSRIVCALHNANTTHKHKQLILLAGGAADHLLFRPARPASWKRTSSPMQKRVICPLCCRSNRWASLGRRIEVTGTVGRGPLAVACLLHVSEEWPPAIVNSPIGIEQTHSNKFRQYYSYIARVKSVAQIFGVLV